MKLTPRLLFIPAGVLGVTLMALMLSHGTSSTSTRAIVTIGDIRTVHADVQVAGHGVLGAARLSDGDAIVTGPSGRARVRLDDGTLVVVDAATELRLGANGLNLQHGRLYVQGGVSAKTQVAIGALATTVSSSAAAFEKRAKTQIYCAQGELVVNTGKGQEHVALGETLSITDGAAKVAPEAAFDDWTGGLAVPWSGEDDGASAMPELRSTAEQDSAKPLVIRRERLNVTIDGEVARTRQTTTYFNGSEGQLDAEVRLRLPSGAILSNVSQRYEGSAEVSASLLLAEAGADNQPAGLEWAGAGWLRGTLPAIQAGKTVELSLEYTEWLPIRDRRASYRFPLAQREDAAPVAELEAHVDASRAGTSWLSANAGTRVVNEHNVELRKSDVRPSGDLVVELEPSVARPGRARAYVQGGTKGEDPYLLVRTEVPELPDPSVALALVIDASMSVGSAGLETERAVVEAILQGLGAHDSLVVMAADQTLRPLGPGVPKPATPELRAELEKQLSELRPGGASNLGSALEQAADILDGATPAGHNGSGMLVYIGDGRATVGEISARDLRRRLARRASGIPRLAAVAVGLAADRWTLAELVAGSGPIYQVADRADAARIGAALLSDAVEPTLRDVDLDLGPTVDRIYPREAHTALAGSTVTVSGRLRGKLPDHIGFRFRKGTALVQESRPLDAISAPLGADLVQRWAAARVEESVARGDGIAAAVALAKNSGLLTPWTSFIFQGGTSASTIPLGQRILELSPSRDAAFAAALGAVQKPQSILLEPTVATSNSASLDAAAAAAARRSIGDATDSLRACRDARAAVRADTTSVLQIELVVDAKGHATDVRVTPDGGSVDPVLQRCVKSVVESIPFFDAGSPVKVVRRVVLPQPRATRRTQCSVVSQLPLALRRSVWQRRLSSGQLDYVRAARSCELPAWRDRRELLVLLLEGKTAEQAMQLAGTVADAGETDAQHFVKDEALRRVTSTDDLAALSRILLLEEPNIDAELEKAYRAQHTNEERLAVVRRFLRLAPHSGLARRRLFALLEALGQREVLVTEIAHARHDPFADAGLLAAGASALRRVGLDDEGRRAFAELLERAPGDPWTLAYVGDRLRAEGLFEAAVAAYDSLAHVMPHDPNVSLRLALAYAGTGRLDVATRLLDGVAQSSGRGDDGRLGELASITQAVLLADARSQAVPADVAAELLRRLTQAPLPDVASLVMVRAAPSDAPVEVRVAREHSGRDGELPDLDASALGLSAIRIERGDGATRIRLRRPEEPGPSRSTRVTVAVLVMADDRSKTRLITREVELSQDGKIIELNWNGEALL